jgi:hypothetical protein
MSSFTENFLNYKTPEAKSPYDKAFDALIGQSWSTEEAAELILLIKMGERPVK